MFTASGGVGDVRIYNTFVGFHKIRALAREHKIYQPLTLSLPAGKRSYIDQATKFYKHRVPDRSYMKYPHGDDIKFDQASVRTKEGVDLTLCTAFSAAIEGRCMDTY